jgi:hypothetical protein
MPKFHALEVLAGLAAAAAILAPALPAQARPLAPAAKPDAHVVSSMTQTPVYFRALPDARCLIGAGPSRTLTVYANDDGIVRFFAQPGRLAASSINLTAACDADGRQVTIPLAIRAVSGPVHSVRPRPVADRTFSLPRGFNPVTASEDELDRYGYPPRPDADSTPDAYAEWLRAVTLAKTWVAPTGVLRTDHVNARARFDSNQQSTNWSGMVDKGATGQFTKALGKWHVPAVITDAAHSPAYSSLWVGLDGYTSNDLVQDGTESDAVDVIGWLVTSYFVWIEYVPDQGMTELPNFDVNPGDEVYMSVKTCRNGRNQLMGCYFLDNLTLGERTTAVERPANAKFTGNNAEWILERPTIIGQGLFDLPDYFFAETTDMMTLDTTKGKYIAYGLEPFDTISMFNGNDQLSSPTFLTNKSTLLSWTNFR